MATGRHLDNFKVPYLYKGHPFHLVFGSRWGLWEKTMREEYTLDWYNLKYFLFIFIFSYIVGSHLLISIQSRWHLDFASVCTRVFRTDEFCIVCCLFNTNFRNSQLSINIKYYSFIARNFYLYCRLNVIRKEIHSCLIWYAFPTVLIKYDICSLKCNRNRLAAGLRPDPMGSLSAPPDL